MTEYPHICITDPHSTIFELFDPTRIWLFQYSHGICHWKIKIYTMYSHIYLQFDHFWAYLTQPAFDQMIFALNRTRLFYLGIRSFTIFTRNPKNILVQNQIPDRSLIIIPFFSFYRLLYLKKKKTQRKQLKKPKPNEPQWSKKPSDILKINQIEPNQKIIYLRGEKIWPST